MEHKCNINTISPAQFLCSRGWGGILGVVNCHPLPQECKCSFFLPPASCGRCSFCLNLLSSRFELTEACRASFLATLRGYHIAYDEAILWVQPGCSVHSLNSSDGLSMSFGKSHAILWSCKLLWMWVKSGFLFISRVPHTGTLPTAMQLGFTRPSTWKMQMWWSLFFFFWLKISLIIVIRWPPKQSWCTFFHGIIAQSALLCGAKCQKQQAKKWDGCNFTKKADFS